MKKILLFLIPILFILSCEEEKEETATDDPLPIGENVIGLWEGFSICGYANSDCTGDCQSVGYCEDADGYELDDVEDQESCDAAGGTWEEETPEGFWVVFNEDGTVGQPAVCWDEESDEDVLMEDSTQCDGEWSDYETFATYVIIDSLITLTLIEYPEDYSLYYQEDGTIDVHFEEGGRCDCIDDYYYNCDWDELDDAEDQESCEALEGGEWQEAECLSVQMMKIN